jgi:hypothetical protein
VDCGAGAVLVLRLGRYDWAGIPLTLPGQVGVRRPDPVPAAVRNGPRVHLPYRDYLLYAGPVEAVTAVAPLSGLEQTPILWWPADRAWCVATESICPGPTSVVRLG